MAKIRFVKILGVVLALLLLLTTNQFGPAGILLAQTGAETKTLAKQITFLADPEIREVEAKYIGQTGIPFASACDIAKDNKSMVVINYGTGFLFLRRTAANGHIEEWSESFKREPVLFVLPKMRQSEAVCFSKDAKSIFLTSEQVLTPLIQMTLPVDVAIGR